MNSERTIAILRRVYDEVHLALWAALTAFVVYFAAFVAPDLPRIQARAQTLRAQAVATEQNSACDNLGMGAKSPMYERCIADLRRYRAHIEQQFADESDIF